MPILEEMRKFVSIAIALGIALVASGCSGSGSGSSGSSAPGTPALVSTASYGNAKISAKATGSGFARTIVIRAKDKKSGLPVRGAEVSIYGEMTSPMLMTLIQRDLREASPGTYKGQYTFIHAALWTVNIVVRKKGDTTTSALPVRIGG